MDTFVSTYPNQTSAFIKSFNPSMKTFGYDYDLTICQNMVCSDTQGPNTSQDSLPEDEYLHFSQDTQVQMIALNGTSKGTATITGCPAPGPVTASCRVQVYIWNDARWVINLKNPTWQQWYADHLLDEMNHDQNNIANPVDGLFLDEHGGPGFSTTMAFGDQTNILSGGAIREYNDVVPRDPRVTQTLNALDTAYTTDVNAWLQYLRSRLSAVGKFAMINTAEYFMTPLAFSENVAINGGLTELLHGADRFRLGATQYQQFLDQVHQIVQAGGTLDLMNAPCSPGPNAFTPGNYANAQQRYDMWNLASYYMAKEATNESGKTYFDPNICINLNSQTPLDFEQQWLNAYEKNVGQPIDAAAVLSQGPQTCDAQPYKIFVRHYTNSTVLVRPRGGYNCTDYSDATAVTVPLSSPMEMLNPDGTLSAPMNSVQIRNADSVILFPAPDTTAPSAVQDLMAE